MSTSPSPIVWDFNRQVTTQANALGGVVHYYDENAQSIYLDWGIKSRASFPEKGQWETAVLGAEKDINTVPYVDSGIDHPSTGVLYMSLIKPDGTVEFVRYQYAMDLSNITETATYMSKIDNPITQITATIGNIDASLFQSDQSLFSPGAKLQLGMAMGASEVYPIGVAWVDESPFNPLSNTVRLSGRNSIGYFLRESTFGNTTSFTGTFPEICTLLFELAGVPKYSFADGTWSTTYLVNSTDSILDGFTNINNLAYYNPPNPMVLHELPDGTVVNNYTDWFQNVLPNTFYTFDKEKDVFARNMKKNIDAVFFSVYATGKDANGTALTPVVADIKNYSYWNIPKNKYIHITAPDNFVTTQAELQTYAEAEATRRQYTGITEDFTSPIRPQLLVGDVAEFMKDGVAETIGMVTQVTHTMGRAGFTTSFSTASGGEIHVVEGGVVTTATGERGYNRKQTLTDIMGIVAKK